MVDICFESKVTLLYYLSDIMSQLAGTGAGGTV